MLQCGAAGYSLREMREGGYSCLGSQLDFLRFARFARFVRFVRFRGLVLFSVMQLFRERRWVSGVCRRMSPQQHT